MCKEKQTGKRTRWNKEGIFFPKQKDQADFRGGKKKKRIHLQKDVINLKMDLTPDLVTVKKIILIYLYHRELYFSNNTLVMKKGEKGIF